jgi:hypothetical protein
MRKIDKKTILMIIGQYIINIRKGVENNLREL